MSLDRSGREPASAGEEKPLQSVVGLSATQGVNIAEPTVTQPESSVTRLRQTIAQPVLAAFLAGGVAGAVSRTVVSPLERLKILFQVQSAGREEYKMSVGKGLMKMWKEEGWRGFMRGNGTNCIRIIPYSAVQFGSYNFYKKVCLISPLATLIEGSRIINLNLILMLDYLLVCRDCSRRDDCFQTIVLWRCSWYHLCRLHLPS